MIIVHLVVVKMFDKCLLTGWSVAGFLCFNLFNNVVREPIIDEFVF